MLRSPRRARRGGSREELTHQASEPNSKAVLSPSALRDAAGQRGIWPSQTPPPHKEREAGHLVRKQARWVGWLRGGSESRHREVGDSELLITVAPAAHGSSLFNAGQGNIFILLLTGFCFVLLAVSLLNAGPAV